MAQRRIGPADLVPGEPLPWDLYLADHSAGPQLRKGQIITDGTQLGRLLQLGLYVGTPEQPSVLRLVNEAAQRLERMASLCILVSAGILLSAVGFAQPSLTAGALFYLVSSTLALSALFLLAELIERSRSANDLPLDEEIDALS